MLLFYWSCCILLGVKAKPQGQNTACLDRC